MTGPATRTVGDTIFAPDGTPLTGQLIISTPETFTSPDGFVILQGFTIFVPVVNGAFSVNLIPFASYQVKVTATETYFIQVWNVPTGTGDLTLIQVLVS